MNIGNMLKGFWRGRVNREETHPVPIPSDTPIAGSTQDLLDRSPMARRIAQILATPSAPDGRVFAIRGAWGYGKSSLKNLVIEALAATAPDVIVLGFNPWQWGDADTIARALFTQMAGKLGGSHSPDATRRARAMRTYGGLLVGGAGKLDKLGHNATGIASLLGGAAIVYAVVGVSVPGITAATMSVAVLTLAAAALAIGWGLNWFGRDRTTDTLDDICGAVQQRLAALSRPLVVFVDDIDRLEPEQIRLVTRQIKANASLSNINFVLLFQPNIVEEALRPVSAGEGRDYLEKIVQANFDLPPSRTTGFCRYSCSN